MNRTSENQPKGFESKFSAAIDAHREVTRYSEFTERRDRPDFKVSLRGAPPIWVELKEKKQPYNIDNWPIVRESGIPERHAFIEDELSVRRLMSYGMYSFLVVKDRPHDHHIVYDFHDLLHMPRIRVNRDNGDHKKGKWIMSYSWGVGFPRIKQTISYLTTSLARIEWKAGRSKKLPPVRCLPEYGSKVPSQGLERNDNWKRKDILEK